jgi:hypothetical protein
MNNYVQVWDDADHVFKIAELVSAGWHLIYAEIPYGRMETAKTWCSAAGEDVLLIGEFVEDNGEEDEEEEDEVYEIDPNTRVRHILLIKDKLRAAQFCLEFL